MLFLKSWLEKYVILSGLDNAELVEKITLGSSEVEEVIMLKDIFDAKVLVGRIENVRNHENAHRLNVFDINLGSFGSRQIVSAAPNVKEGIIVPVAVEGARLPYMTIANRQMRGIESQGMCLGKSELMLETSPSEGLYELGEELSQLVPTKYSTIESVFGQSICAIFPDLFEEDVLFDVKVLPNRMSEIGHHLGLAREISLLFPDALTTTDELKQIEEEARVLEKFQSNLNSLKQSEIRFEFEDKVDYVNSFALLQAKLENAYYLPKEYQRHMFLSGRNLVGTIADLSNYFLADFGQPTHIFDTKKVTDEHKTVHWVADRTVKPMPFVGLGQLKDTILPIGTPILYNSNNADNILAVPAISGSDSSKTEYNNTDLLVEIANFDADDVAQASFDLKYRSDGSRMWSGGVNKQLIAYTVNRLLAEDGIEFSLCGMYDKKTKTVTSAQQVQSLINDYFAQNSAVTVDWKYIARRFDGRGEDYWLPILEEKLRSLGSLKGDVFVPNGLLSNITTQNDVLEELIRLIDYKQLAHESISGGRIDSNHGAVENSETKYESLLYLKNVVSKLGFQEVITRPFVSANHLQSQDEQNTIKVLKPYNSLMPYVRDNLESSLLLSLSENILRGEKDPLIFELGLVYTREGDVVNAPRQLCLVGIHEHPYVFTSALHQILSTNKQFEGGNWEEYQDDSGKGFVFKQQNEVVATVKEISNSHKKVYNIPLNKKVYAIAVELKKPFSEFNYATYTDETQFPVVRRSYSYRIEKKIRLCDILSKLNTLIPAENTQQIEIKIIPLERISENADTDILNFSVTYKNFERTFDSADISSYEQKILSILQLLGQVSAR